MIRKMCVCVGFLKYVWVGACVVLCVEIISAILKLKKGEKKIKVEEYRVRFVFGEAINSQ